MSAVVSHIFYRGDRVRITTPDDWSSFSGMRGCVVEIKADRVAVHLDGDRGPTLFWPSEVQPDPQ